MPIRKRLVYAARHFTPTWRYLFNLRSTISYRHDRHRLGEESRRVVDDLDRDGIAITNTERLFGRDSSFDELGEAVEKLEQSWSEKLRMARMESERAEIGRKTFILQMLGTQPSLDPQSIYAGFALQPRILEIANAYFEMYTQLRYYNVWHTLTTEGPARESQLWHYDREDHRILKLFVYLSDVDDGAGPFTYAPGTHRGNSIRGRGNSIATSINENGVRRWSDDQMKSIVNPERWIRAVGPRGTMVFADTRGYHKGGLARNRDRILYTCMFTSPTSQAPELFERPAEIILPKDKAQALALARPARGILG